MPLDFRQIRFTFPSASGGPQTLERNVTFASEIRRAQTFLQGFLAGFTDDARPLWKLGVDTEIVGFQKNVVRVRATLALRDNTGNWNDAFEGKMDVVIVVDRI